MFKRQLVGVGAMLVASFALGCGASGNKNETDMRVINASPNGPAMTALLNGAVIQQNIAYATQPSYQVVDEDSKTIEMRNAATGATLFTQSVSLEHERHYTEIATGMIASIGSLFIEDANNDPSSGTAAFRFIQVAPSMPVVDVYLTPSGTSITSINPTIGNVAFNKATAYVSVPANTYTLSVTAAGTKSVLLTVPNLALPSLAVRSILSLDKPGGGAPFQSMTLVDRN